MGNPPRSRPGRHARKAYEPHPRSKLLKRASKRRRPARAAIPSQKRISLAQKPAAKTNGVKRNRIPEQARSAKRPTRAKPLHIDCVFGTPANWRVRRGSANARLGHACPWYATYSSHISTSLRPFPTKKTAPAPAKAQADAASEQRGSPTCDTTKPLWADATTSCCASASPTRGTTKTAPAPAKARGGYRRILEGGGSPTHGNRQSTPWREEDAQGAFAFRTGYLSLGASFTSCPRLASTGMVMALAGQASTQALQRVQSASVRSP